MINMPPIVYNLPKKKTPTRKVFTFAGIQSSKAVTYDRHHDKVFNNVYPDEPRTSGLEIPKSLRIVEDRPKSQINTKQYRKKRLTKVEEYKKVFKKCERVKVQRENWKQIEEKGEVVKKWYKNEENAVVEKKDKRRLKTPPKKKMKPKPSLPKKKPQKKALRRKAPKKRVSKKKKAVKRKTSKKKK